MKNKTKQYPFQDTISILLAGELWKDIESYEGFYQVSNFGRVKSLEREIPHQRLGKQRIALRIMNQKVLINKNTISEKKIVDLQVALTKEGKTNFHNVRRLVYNEFVKPINYKKDGFSIVNIDGDGFNCHWENLRALTQREKRKRSKELARIPTCYSTLADHSPNKQMSILSQNLRFLRKKEALSQEKLAQQISRSRSCYQKYEEGKTEPPINVLLSLSEFYNVSIDHLIKVDISQKPPEA